MSFYTSTASIPLPLFTQLVMYQLPIDVQTVAHVFNNVETSTDIFYTYFTLTDYLKDLPGMSPS